MKVYKTYVKHLGNQSDIIPFECDCPKGNCICSRLRTLFPLVGISASLWTEEHPTMESFTFDNKVYATIHIDVVDLVHEYAHLLAATEKRRRKLNCYLSSMSAERSQDEEILTCYIQWYLLTKLGIENKLKDIMDSYGFTGSETIEEMVFKGENFLQKERKEFFAKIEKW